MTQLKFRTGDIACTWLGTKVRILRSFAKNGDIYYLAQFVDSKVRTEFREADLSFNYDDLHKSKQVKENYQPPSPKCPRCDTSWVSSKFGQRTWYDCPKCKKTSEDLCKV